MASPLARLMHPGGALLAVALGDAVTLPLLAAGALIGLGVCGCASPSGTRTTGTTTDGRARNRPR